MSPAFYARVPVVVAFTLLVGGGIFGCRSDNVETDPIDTEVTPPATGGRKATGGSTGAKGGGSGMAAGGATGMAPAGSGGAAPSGSGGAVAADSGAASDVPVIPVGTPDTAPADDVAAPAPDTGTAPTTPGAGPLGPNGIAICHADPTVIAICKQLENACENCPPGGAPPGNKLAVVCFDLIKKAKAGMATDAECAKFAVDNKCKVDNGGNVCGSLNCTVAGCNKAECDKWQQWGDASKCRPLMAKCSPCK
jgi:hypothetical protein